MFLVYRGKLRCYGNFISGVQKRAVDLRRSVDDIRLSSGGGRAILRGVGSKDICHIREILFASPRLYLVCGKLYSRALSIPILFEEFLDLFNGIVYVHAVAAFSLFKNEDSVLSFDGIVYCGLSKLFGMCFQIPLHCVGSGGKGKLKLLLFSVFHPLLLFKAL